MMKSYRTGWGETMDTRLKNLEEQRAAVEKRINDGWTWLANNAGHRRFRRYEDEWIRLLREYEALSDQIAGLVKDP